MFKKKKKEKTVENHHKKVTMYNYNLFLAESV